MTKLAGQTAIITGGARGIGRAIAERLAQDGARIILWDRDFAALEAQPMPIAPLLTQVVDVSDRLSVERAFAAALDKAGAIDILVNNAGINGPVMPVWEYSPEDWDKVLRIDLDSVFFCSRAAIPHMRARRRGRIINVASMAGKEGVPGIAAYSAAKGGVIAFTKAIAKELAEDGVLANCIAPAITQTELMKQMTPEHIAAMKAKIPMGRFVAVEEVGALASFIAGPDCTFTTGFVFDLSGGRATY